MRPEDHANKPGAVGRPMFGADVSLRDDDGNPVGDGEMGEIWVRSNAQMEGYYCQPDVTAEIQRGEWMASGDLAVRDAAGFHTIVGRKKDTIKTGGATVYPAEVEAVLLTHPDVREAAVLGLPDEQWGELVVAAVIPEAGATIDERSLIAHAAADLATYKRPRAIFVVGELPMSAAGKVSKRDLKPVLAEMQLKRMHD
jgi:acyl-CoA synthetase (AMP-forming)/AMP-acid ligase II